MEVVIKLSETEVVLRNVSSVEVLGMTAGALGFLSDVEPMEPGRVRATAYGENDTFSAYGTSVNDACEKLIAKLATAEGKKE